MIKPITLEDWKWIPTGDADFKTIKENLESLADKLNDTIDELNAVKSIKQKFMRVVLVDSALPKTILEARDHENAKIVSGFVMIADNLEMEQTITIYSKNQWLTEPIIIKSKEKSGKVQPLTIFSLRTIGKFDYVNVVSTSARKVVVSLLLEEV